MAESSVQAAAWRMARRYAGVGAAFAYSGANFLLAFYLQKATGIAAFGLFALVQVYVQFGMSLSNGLFCSPIILAIQSETGRRRREIIASFARVSLLASLAGATALYAAVFALAQDPLIALLAAIYGVGSWTRWFFRSVELADGHVLRPASADVLYSMIVCMGLAAMVLLKAESIQTAFAVQTAGCLAAFGAMAGSAFAALRGVFKAPSAPFIDSFRKHGRWAVLGVVTTEATANAHPYIIGALLGPAAFAPIAAVTLFYRPLSIVAQALTQYERPRMAKALKAGDMVAVQRDVRQFTFASLLAWGGNVALVVALVFCFKGVIGNADYAHGEIQTATILLAAVYLARSLRGGESAALQAEGLFRPLAWITVFTAPLSLSVVGVVVIIAPSAVVWSLVGVLVGEVGTCLLIRRTWNAHVMTKTGLAEEKPQCAS